MGRNKRQSLRALYHIRDHSDAAIGALERNDVAEARIQMDMLRGLVNGAIDVEETAKRSDDV